MKSKIFQKEYTPDKDMTSFSKEMLWRDFIHNLENFDQFAKYKTTILNQLFEEILYNYQNSSENKICYIPEHNHRFNILFIQEVDFYLKDKTIIKKRVEDIVNKIKFKKKIKNVR